MKAVGQAKKGFSCVLMMHNPVWSTQNSPPFTVSLSIPDDVEVLLILDLTPLEKEKKKVKKRQVPPNWRQYCLPLAIAASNKHTDSKRTTVTFFYPRDNHDSSLSLVLESDPFFFPFGWSDGWSDGRMKPL